MKRALIVLLLLAVAAGGLFAQLTISGNVQSGLEVVIPNEGDTTFNWRTTDAGMTYRFHLGASYTNEAGTVGASGALRNNAGSPAIDGGNAWVKLLDKQLHLQIGNGAPGGFGSQGNFGEGHNAADANFNAVFAPAGTNFSVGLGISPAGDIFTKATYGFGLKVGVPNVLTAVANANFVPDTEVANAAAGVSISALNAPSGETGISSLGVDVVAKNVTDLKWIGIGPQVGFRIAGVGADNLNLGLRSRIFLPLDDSVELDYWVGLDVGVNLTPNVGLNINGGYEANANARTNGDLGSPNGEGTGREIGGSGNAGFIVRPQLDFNLGGGAHIITGWSLQAVMADEMFLQNAIYARLAVSF